MSPTLSFHNPQFEDAVRRATGIDVGPITADDATTVVELEMDFFRFSPEDIETLFSFRSLKKLSLELYGFYLNRRLPFPELEEFTLFADSCVTCPGLNLCCLRDLQKLRSLEISGGDLSHMELLFPEVLTELKMLRELTFHEFGSVDLSFLEGMQELRYFGCMYADEVTSIDTVAALPNLELLELHALRLKNLGFLNLLRDDTELVLSGLNLSEVPDRRKLKRFRHLDISDTELNGRSTWDQPIDRDNDPRLCMSKLLRNRKFPIPLAAALVEPMRGKSSAEKDLIAEDLIFFVKRGDITAETPIHEAKEWRQKFASR